MRSSARVYQRLENEASTAQENTHLVTASDSDLTIENPVHVKSNIESGANSSLSSLEVAAGVAEGFTVGAAMGGFTAAAAGASQGGIIASAIGGGFGCLGLTALGLFMCAKKDSQEEPQPIPTSTPTPFSMK